MKKLRMKNPPEFPKGGVVGLIYGYARVSTKGQDRYGNSLEAQEKLLREAGAERILCESFTGTKKSRPQLDELMELVCAGDTVVMTKLDRMARSTRDGLDIIDEFLAKGVEINILNMGKFDDSPSGKLMRTIFLAFAEFERDMIVERTQSGKAIAKANGKRVDGRPKKFKPEQMEHAMHLLESNSFTEVERMTGISKNTLVRESRRRKA